MRENSRQGVKPPYNEFTEGSIMSVALAPLSAREWYERHGWKISHDRIEEAVRRVVAACDPLRVVAFGSWARGEDQAGSDLDLAVFLDARSDRRASQFLYVDIGDLPLPVDILAFGVEEHERLKHSPNSVHRYIELDGKVLYERAHGSAN
jgi:predicted nucleotidyltransferase